MRHLLFVIPITLLLIFSSCYTTRHHVGSQSGQVTRVESEKSVWLLWGLVTVRNADSGEMAKTYSAENYLLVEQFDVVDYLIVILSGGLVTTRTYRMKILE